MQSISYLTIYVKFKYPNFPICPENHSNHQTVYYHSSSAMAENALMILAMVDVTKVGHYVLILISYDFIS